MYTKSIPSSTLKNPETLKCNKAMSTTAVSESDCFWKITKASNHPVIMTKINRLRRKDTDSKLFRELMYEIGTFLAYEATSDLTLNDSKTVERIIPKQISHAL